MIWLRTLFSMRTKPFDIIRTKWRLQEQPDFIRHEGVGVHAISPETNPRSIFELLSDDFATGGT